MFIGQLVWAISILDVTNTPGNALVYDGKCPLLFCIFIVNSYVDIYIYIYILCSKLYNYPLSYFAS